MWILQGHLRIWDKKGGQKVAKMGSKWPKLGPKSVKFDVPMVSTSILPKGGQKGSKMGGQRDQPAGKKGGSKRGVKRGPKRGSKSAQGSTPYDSIFSKPDFLPFFDGSKKKFSKSDEIFYI